MSQSQTIHHRDEERKLSAVCPCPISTMCPFILPNGCRCLSPPSSRLPLPYVLHPLCWYITRAAVAGCSLFRRSAPVHARRRHHCLQDTPLAAAIPLPSRTMRSGPPLTAAPQTHASAKLLPFSFTMNMTTQPSAVLDPPRKRRGSVADCRAAGESDEAGPLRGHGLYRHPPHLVIVNQRAALLELLVLQMDTTGQCWDVQLTMRLRISTSTLCKRLACMVAMCRQVWLPHAKCCTHLAVSGDVAPAHVGAAAAAAHVRQRVDARRQVLLQHRSMCSHRISANVL